MAYKVKKYIEIFHNQHLYTFKAVPGSTVMYAKIYIQYKFFKIYILIILSARILVQEWSFPVQHHLCPKEYKWGLRAEMSCPRIPAKLQARCLSCSLLASTHSVTPHQISLEVRLGANLPSLCHGHGLGSLFQHSPHGSCRQPRRAYGNSLWTSKCQLWT